jgi:hypothetical protein
MKLAGIAFKFVLISLSLSLSGTDFDEFRLTGGAAWMCQQVDQGWVFCIAHGGNQDA